MVFRRLFEGYFLGIKPISIIELKDATAKAAYKNKPGNNKQSKSFKSIIDIKADFGAHKIGLPVSDGILFINSEEIIRINAKGSYSIIYMLNNKKITCPKNLKFLE